MAKMCTCVYVCVQATSARRCEELSQEKATLDAALQTARQDLKQSQAKVEALSAQLSSAEDAVKVNKPACLHALCDVHAWRHGPLAYCA